MNSNKFFKATSLVVIGLLLFLAGGNPNIQNVVGDVMPMIESPIAYADGNLFNLHRKITHKQFSYVDSDSYSGTSDNHNNSFANYANKRVSKKADNYMGHVGNLKNYYVHISHSDMNPNYNNSHSEAIENVTFIKK